MFQERQLSVQTLTIQDSVQMLGLVLGLLFVFGADGAGAVAVGGTVTVILMEIPQTRA